jgi:hypothetical protein
MKYEVNVPTAMGGTFLPAMRAWPCTCVDMANDRRFGLGWIDAEVFLISE